jgi:hypothetical protein
LPQTLHFKTNEEFLEQLQLKNQTIVPLEQYKGSKVKILCRCRICNHQWRAIPANLLFGRKCPECGKHTSANARRKTNEHFVQEVSEIHPEIEILEQYVNCKTKILLQCKKCGHEWRSVPTSILQGHGCPSCGGSMKWDNDRFIHELEKLNPYIQPIETYINARTPILCKCLICNHTWKAIPNKILYETSCPNCSRYKKTSFPEQAIYFYISRIFPDAVSRYKGIEDIGELDVYIPETKTAIEYDC